MKYTGWSIVALMVVGCGGASPADEGAGETGTEATGSSVSGSQTATGAEGSATATSVGGSTTGNDGESSGVTSGETGSETSDTGAEPVDLCAGLVDGDLADHPQSALSPPSVGEAVVDPEFGTTIVRVSSGGVPMYSTVSAWNADESRMILYHPGSGHRLYDGMTYAELGPLPIGPNDLELVYWDTSNPDVFYFPQGATLQAYSLASGSATTVTTFDGCDGDVNAGGDPFFSSFDSARFGFKCGSTHLVYDRVEDTMLGLESSGFDLGPQVAPTGRRAFWQGLVVAPDLSTELDLMLASPYEHASMGWNIEGRDTYLTVVYDGADVGSLAAYDMETGMGEVVVGPDTGYPYPPGGTHVSGLAYANPGWAALSVVGDGQGDTLLHGEIIVANWETGQVCRAAHHRASGDDYFAEPHAIPSPTGTRILFGSDWAGGLDGFVLELPAFTQ